MSVTLSARVAEGETLPGAAAALRGLASLTAAVYGLGGLGVVGLTRLLAEALQERFLRTATTETRGIAQRRAPVSSTVRAGSAVRSATAPDRSAQLVVALEASEALRAAPLMRAGTVCLLSDLSVAPSTRSAIALPSAASIQALLEPLGVRVVPLQVQQWLSNNRLGDVLASSVAYGALVALLDLPVARCESLLLHRLLGARRDENEAAFHWGVSQLQPPRSVEAPSRAPVAAVPSNDSMAPCFDDPSSTLPELAVA